MTIKAAQKRLKEHWGAAFVLFCFFLAAIYICVRGTQIWVHVHDNLEDFLPRTYLLREYGGAFSHNATIPVLGGLTRNDLPSELKVHTWLFLLLPPFYAYIVSAYLKVILAIAGWLMLAKCLPALFGTNKNVTVLLGFLYGILPTVPSFTLAFGSLPLLAALLCSIYRRPSWKKYLLLFLYPALSDLTYFGLFICGYLLIFIIWNTVYEKRFPFHMLLALAVVAVGYIIMDYRLFMQVLLSNTPTIREEVVIGGMPLTKALWTGIQAFFNGHYHSSTVYRLFIVRACLIYFAVLNFRYLFSGQFKEMFRDSFNWLIAWAAFNALLFGLQEYRPLDDLIATVIPPLKGFQIARTLWFNPFIWMLAFTVMITRIGNSGLSQMAPVFLAACAIFTVIFFPDTYNTIQLNIKNCIKESARMEVADATWKEFYSEELFSEVKEEIAYQGEWSVAFGLHPGVLYWNGISTLDGYLAYYPLEYKHAFGELIAPVLEQSEYLASYFGGYGGRAYVFPLASNGDNDALITSRVSSAAPCDMLMDADVFREMGGRYVFSALEITNADELGLTCLGVWESGDSIYTIRVYDAVAG